MEFQVLGPVAVRVRGETVRLRRKEAHLLARLLANAGRPIGVDDLIGELWGDEFDYDACRNALRVHLSHLRQALRHDGDAPSRIVTTPLGYTVVVNAGELDAGLLNGCLLKARGLSETPDVALMWAHRGFAVWRGDPFDGFDSPVVNASRSLLEVTYLDLCVELAELESKYSPNPDRALLIRLQKQQGTSEPIACALSRAEYRRGDQARALDTLRRFRRTLDVELGLEPTAALREFEQAILREDLAVPTARSQLHLRFAPELDDDLPLAERDAELDLCLSALGRPGARIAVHGPRGIGRSALLTALARRLPGALKVAGRQSGSLAAAFTQLIESSDQGALDRHWRLDVATAGSVAPSSALAGQAVSALVKLTEPVLIIDDVGHIDADSRALLLDVMGRAHRTVALVVSAVDAASAFAVLDRDGISSSEVVDVALKPLTLSGCAELLSLSGVSPRGEVAGTLARTLLDRSGGHPYLAAAHTRDLARADTARPMSGSALEFTRRVRAELTGRGRRVLDLAAVDGPQLTLRVLARAANLPIAELLEVVEELLLVGLVTDDDRPALSAGFSPLLLRIVGAAAPALHLSLANAYREEPGAMSAEIVRHLRAAGSLVHESELAVAADVAAREAYDAGQLLTGIDLHDVALASAERGGVAVLDRLEWTLAQVEARFRAGQLARGATDAATVAVRAERYRAYGVFARASILAATPMTPERDERVRARRMLARVVSHGPELSDPMKATTLEALARTLQLDRPESTQGIVEHLVKDLREVVAASDNEEDRGMALLGLRQAAVIEGQPAAGRLALSSASVEELRIAHPARLLAALRARSSDAIEAAVAEAESLVSEYAELAAVFRVPFHYWLSQRLLASCALARRDVAASSAALDRSHELEEFIDAEVVAIADVVHDFAFVWQSRGSAPGSFGLPELDQVDDIYRPVIALAEAALGVRVGIAPSAELVGAAVDSLTTSSLHLPGYAFAAVCVSHLPPAEAVRVGLQCRQSMMTHHRSQVVLEGGLADLGSVKEFLRTLPDTGQNPRAST